MAVAALCAVVAGASALTVATGTFSVNVGEAVDVPISLDSVPNGLIGAGFTATLGNGATADIIGYAKPGWASFAHTTPDPITAVDSATISIIDMTGVAVPLGATNVSLGTLKVRGMAAGTTSIEIVPTAGLGIEDRSGFLYEVTALPGTLTAVPALKTITPTMGRRGATVSTTITGSGFAGPATVTLSQDTPADPLSPHVIPATSVVVVSSTEITCDFAPDADGPTGIFDLTVSMPGGSTATKAGAFTVYDPLSVSAIAPDTGVQGTTVHATITGTGFVSPATANLSQYNPEAPPIPRLIPAANVVVVSPTQITCDVVLDATGPLGALDLVVTMPDGVSVTTSGAFTAFAPLTISSITPVWGGRGMTVSATITGSGFVDPGSATLSLDTSAAPLSPHVIPATSVVVVSSTEITCTFALDADGPIGTFDLIVTNPGGRTATKAGAFTVYDPLSVSAIAPDTGVQGTTVHATITGTGFVSPVTLNLSQPDPSAPLVPHLVPATSVVVVSPTQITCDFVLETTGATGIFDLVVTDSVGASATKTGAFTITVPLTPTPTPGVIVYQIPGGVGIPTDLNADTLFDDVNGNGHADFADVVLFFNQMIWIAANEPISAFDFNGNGRIDFADVVWLFQHL